MYGANTAVLQLAVFAMVLSFSQNISLFFSVSDNLVADPGEGPGGARPLPLFLDQIEARRAEKVFFYLPNCYFET